MISEENNENFVKPDVWSLALKYGLLLGGVLIIMNLASELGGLSDVAVIRYLDYVVAIAIIVLAHRDFKEKGDSFMSYSKGLGIGTIIGFISSALESIYSYIYIKYVDSGILKEMEDAQVEALMESGQDQEVIEETLQMMSKIMNAEFISIIGFISAGFFYFVLSLIITAFTRKEDPNPEFK